MGTTIETAHGALGLTLPAGIGAVSTATNHDKARAAVNDSAGETAFVDSFSKYEIAGGAAAIALGLVIAGLKILSMRAKFRAIDFLKERLPRSNATIGAQVDRGLADFRVHRSWKYLGDGSRQMENLGGLSAEAGRLAADMADLLDARAGDDKSTLDIVLREVGMTSRFADYWVDAGHTTNAWRMNLASLMLYGRVHDVGDRSRDAIGRTLMKGASRKRDFTPERVFGIAAWEQQRIGRARRIETEIYPWELTLVQALHMLAATALWLERADYASRPYDRQLSVYYAKGTLSEANIGLSDVYAKKPEWFDAEGSPLTRIMSSGFDMTEEIDYRDISHDPPPDDLGIGGAFMGGGGAGDGEARAAGTDDGKSFMGGLLFAEDALPAAAWAPMAGGLPVLSMI